jgi:FixJ family two-component response regulator/anti-sigma regulatory factor (Ser/Thr protein kinase)
VLKSTARRSVLVVDDDEIFRKIARSTLAEAGFEVLAATDVRSARAIFDRVDVDSMVCVLVDYALPGCCGIELIEWLNQRQPAIAVVLITASPEHWLLERSLRARVCAFLGKPLAPSEIRRAVAAAAQITSQRRAAAEMRHQVEHAGMVQQAELERMLRKGDVSLEYRFHPRHYCSGDFLAYDRLPGGADVFLMTDAAGHDLHASVHSAYFQGMLSGLLRSGRPLAEALDHCNRSLLDRPEGQVSSVSVTALETQPGSGCVSAWNYGAPPPVFVDWKGWIRSLGSHASPPLGWFEDARPTLDRVAVPGGPIWMWTDGLEDLAERLDASPLSVACALLQAPPGEIPEFLAHAEDDVLVARVWPGIAADAAPPGYVQPLIAEEYGPDHIASIDGLQERWIRSLQLALPGLSRSVRYDLALCAREAVLNALQHGCARYDVGSFQIVYQPAAALLEVRVSDPGPGYLFDSAGHAERDFWEPVEGQRGLLLMHAHAARVSMDRAGAEVRMQFPIDSALAERTAR